MERGDCDLLEMEWILNDSYGKVITIVMVSWYKSEQNLENQSFEKV